MIKYYLVILLFTTALCKGQAPNKCAELYKAYEKKDMDLIFEMNDGEILNPACNEELASIAKKIIDCNKDDLEYREFYLEYLKGKSDFKNMLPVLEDLVRIRKEKNLEYSEFSVVYCKILIDSVKYRADIRAYYRKTMKELDLKYYETHNKEDTTGFYSTLAITYYMKGKDYTLNLFKNLMSNNSYYLFDLGYIEGNEATPLLYMKRMGFPKDEPCQEIRVEEPYREPTIEELHPAPVS